MCTCRVLFAQALLVLSAFSLVVAQEYESYQDCRACHSDIFNLWNSSLHARSYSNPSFQAAYLTVLLKKDEATGSTCLRCHAPIAHISGDFDFKSPSALEGVSCWFCHSIFSVNEGSDIDGYYNLDTTGVFYGPYEYTIHTDHPVRHSSLHLSAELCVGCHEYTNDNNVQILGTYSEWKDSYYPQKGIHCQNCHMPIMVDLSVVDGDKSQSHFVTAHEFQGGHSKINLAHAVNMVTHAEEKGSQLHVVIEITNAESGHRLPTGVPVRKLVLRVSLLDKHRMEVSSARRTYRKVLTDQYGTIIENAPDMFLEATSIFSDNRIHPNETRAEEFIFALPDDLEDYVIEASLDYEYTRPLLKEESVRINMAKNRIRESEIE